MTSARRRATRLAAPVSAQAAAGESLEDRTLLTETPLTLVVSEASGGEHPFVQFEVSQASGLAASAAFSQFLARLENGNLARVLAFDDVSATLQFDNAPTLNATKIHTGDVFVLGSAMSLSADVSTDRVFTFGNDVLLPDEDRVAGPDRSDGSGELSEESVPDSALPIAASVAAPVASTGEDSLVAGPVGSALLPPFGELQGPLPSGSTFDHPEANDLSELTGPAETSASLPLAEDLSGFGQSVLETSTDLASAETDAATKPILASASSASGSLEAINIVPDVEASAARSYEATFVPATMSQLASPVTSVLAGLAAAADTVARVVLVALGADGGDGPAASIIDPAAPALDAAAVAGGEAPKWALGKSVDDLLEFSRVTITGGEVEAGLLESAPVMIPPAGQNGVLAVQVETLPQHGELEEIAGRLGQYRYTGDPGFSGVDTFSYLVVTPGGSSSRGLVTIVVPEAAASTRIGLQADINLNHPQAHDFVVELAQSSPTNTSSETAIDESFRQVDLWADEL